MIQCVDLDLPHPDARSIHHLAATIHHLAATGTLSALHAAKVDLNLARSLVWILSWAWLISRDTFSHVVPEGNPASGLAFSESRLAFLACRVRDKKRFLTRSCIVETKQNNDKK